MTKQNLENHTKYYTPHHFVFYPLLLIAIGVSVYAYDHSQHKYIWVAIIAGYIFICWLAFMLRQHYALGNQDRIVRLEMRFRYYVLTGKNLEPLESQLTFRQIAALRFASDEELPPLIERATKENLSSGEIKKSIRHWHPDHMRV